MVAAFRKSLRVGFCLGWRTSFRFWCNATIRQFDGVIVFQHLIAPLEVCLHEGGDFPIRMPLVVGVAREQNAARHVELVAFDVSGHARDRAVDEVGDEDGRGGHGLTRWYRLRAR